MVKPSRLLRAAVICGFVFGCDISYAHPGKTDAAGGHRCWTGCGRWKAHYGAVHYHKEGILDEIKANSAR